MGYNLFISLCASILTLATFALIGDWGPDLIPIALLVFCCCFVVYSWLKKQWKWFYSLLLPGSIFMLEDSLNLVVFIYSVHLGILTYWYGRIINLYFLRLVPLRNIPFVKTVILSYTWASVTVMLPLLFDGYTIDTRIWLFFFERFIFIAGISFVFDIRDFSSDKEGDIVTTPFIIGIPWTKRISGILLLAYLFIILFNYQELFFWPLFASGLLALLFVFLVNKKRQPFYYAAFLDGCMAIQGILVIVWLFI